MTGLAYHRPEDPIAFMQRCLEEVRGRRGYYVWNCFITTTGEERNIFSQTKPLPPIRPQSISSGDDHNQSQMSSGQEASSGHQPLATSLENKPLVFVLGKHCTSHIQWNLYIMDTLGRIILSIIEGLSSFRGKNVLPLYRLVHCLYTEVSFIQRCPLYRGVLYSECPLS